MDVRKHNREAWNKQVELGNPWSIPVSSKIIADAKNGKIAIHLSPAKSVPVQWLSGLKGKKVLCLASGGGQQGPVLAAAGAKVTVLDNSPKQLEQDRLVADREELKIRTVEGNMADLSMFPDNSFNLIVHPISNVFISDVRPVWNEAFRVLKKGGVLLSGRNNPIEYIFDLKKAESTGILEVKYKLPYSDAEQLSKKEILRRKTEGIPLEFSHTLEDQIGGQIDAGFFITGFYEDRDIEKPLDKYTSVYIVTRALKP